MTTTTGPILCPYCGLNLVLVGRAHNCRPANLLANLEEESKVWDKPTFGEELIQSAREASEIAKTIVSVPGERGMRLTTPDEGTGGDVNEVNTPQDTELTKPTPKKRGEYPGTDERRKYMREYMMKKRRGKL